MKEKGGQVNRVGEATLLPLVQTAVRAACSFL